MASFLGSVRDRQLLTTVPNVNPHRLSADTRGTIVFEPEGASSGPVKKVYQRVGDGLGNVPGIPRRNLQLRAHVIPTDPQTAAQLACRQRFADAMAAWATLPTDTKTLYEKRARPLRLKGHNLYTREYIHTHPL